MNIHNQPTPSSEQSPTPLAPGSAPGNPSAVVALGAVALGAASMVAWLARRLDHRSGTPTDRALREEAQQESPLARRVAGKTFSMFGYPVIYMPAAWLISRQLRQEKTEGSDAVLASAVAVWPVYRVLKLVVDRRRPPSQQDDGEELKDRSIPSGHTAGVTALAATTAYVLARQGQISLPLGVTLAAAPIVVGASRIFADEHWASDVVAGALTGLVVAATASEWFETRSGASRVNGAKPAELVLSQAAGAP